MHCIAHYLPQNTYTKQAAGRTPPPVLSLLRRLLTGRRTLCGRDAERIGRFVDEDRARHLRGTGQVVVRHRRIPTATGSIEGDEVVTRRGAPAHVARGGRTGNAPDLAGDFGAVLDGVGAERFLSRHEVTQDGL